MLTYMFPGQGSQKVGMGKELFEDYAEITKQANRILGYSLEDLCMEEDGQRLNKTNYTQPALFVINHLNYLHVRKSLGEKPDYFIGHSLGEYNALLAANVFDFETGLKLVQKRGELMSQAKGGGMAAVIGLIKEDVDNVISKEELNCVIANINAPKQIIISGIKKDIIEGEPIFESAGADFYLPLNVSGAFHSTYMKNAQKQFESFLTDFDFSETTTPVISNCTALPYTKETTKEKLVAQISTVVLWLDSINYLCGLGKMKFKEIGVGNKLTDLLRRIQKKKG